MPQPARWKSLRAAAKQVNIGKRMDDALTLIEQENAKLKGIWDKRYARAQLPNGKLGELVDLISTIGFGDNPVMNDAELIALLANLRELSALGRNINQMSRSLNQNFHSTEQIRLEALAKLNLIVEENKHAVRSLVRASQSSWKAF